MSPAIHIIVEDETKRRIVQESRRQRRSIKAIIVIALERYFSALDAERSGSAGTACTEEEVR